MAVVVDANLLTALATRDARAAAVRAQIQRWLLEGQDLHAPELAVYETANALARLVVGGQYRREHIPTAWGILLSLSITYHPLRESGERVIDVALALGRQNAYDAAYLALAQQLGAELWTFDGPLARNAVGLGFPVHLIR